MIKTRPQRTCRILRARARDINIDAERVVLCAIERASAVAGDDFVSEDIVPCRLVSACGRGRRRNERYTWSESLWNSGRPAVVVCYQHGGSPFLGAKVDAGGVNLDPFECCFINLFALLTTVSSLYGDDSFIAKKYVNVQDCSSRHSWRRRSRRDHRCAARSSTETRQSRQLLP